MTVAVLMVARHKSLLGKKYCVTIVQDRFSHRLWRVNLQKVDVQRVQDIDCVIEQVCIPNTFYYKVGRDK